MPDWDRESLNHAAMKMKIISSLIFSYFIFIIILNLILIQIGIVAPATAVALEYAREQSGED